MFKIKIGKSTQDRLDKFKGTLENPWCPCCLAQVILAKLDEVPIDRDALERLVQSHVSGTVDPFIRDILWNKMNNALLDSDYEKLGRLSYALYRYAGSEYYQDKCEKSVKFSNTGKLN